MLSRIIHGTRISMSIGLVGVASAWCFGILLGGISGYYGGRIDNVIQRVIEFLRSIPTIPLWMGLAAAMPATTGRRSQVYFAITIILSLVGWTDLARVVRGRFLALQERGLRHRGAARRRQRDAASSSATWCRPSSATSSPSVTLAIPVMILAETALRFLGIGLRPPVVSWGVLLQEAQNIRTRRAPRPGCCCPASR